MCLVALLLFARCFEHPVPVLGRGGVLVELAALGHGLGGAVVGPEAEALPEEGEGVVPEVLAVGLEGVGVALERLLPLRGQGGSVLVEELVDSRGLLPADHADEVDLAQQE